MSRIPDEQALRSVFAIRIENLNTDKTRKDIGSATVYHVYFELSGHPPPEWKRLFAVEWQKAGSTRDADADGAFLVLHCELSEIATAQLPLLQSVVSATNEAYSRYALSEEAARKTREDAWELERNAVETVASSLRFTP